MFPSMKKWMIAATLASSSFFASIGQADTTLSFEVFNPGKESIFPVTSTLIVGEKEVALVDAQFQRNDAQTLVNMIKKTGKELKTIYISHGDPDFYFGLDVVTDAFPKAQVLTTPNTHEYIKRTMEPKNAYWGPILKANAPKRLVLPKVIQGDSFKVDNKVVNIIGLDGHDPKHTFLWVPSTKTVLGGVVLYNNMHAWMADTQTPESRQKWFKTLDNMQALKPLSVISGHYLNTEAVDVNAIESTRNYVKAFEAAAAKAKDSKDLMAKLNKQFPDLGGADELSLSAKVIMGEMKWPK